MFRRPLTILLAPVVLVGAACSNDDAADDAAPTSTAAISPARSTTTSDPGASSTTGAPVSPVDLGDISVRLTQVATAEGPTALVPRPGSPDLYVAERAGTVRRLVPSNDAFTVDATPVLDLDDDVADLQGERGLLGLAFSAEGSTLYVSYTDGNDDGASVIAAYTMQGDVADAGSRREILRLAQPFSNHNGGNIVIGPDGDLWIGFGDGGSQGDPSDNGQDRSVLLAKLLRIDVSASATAGGYTVPADNPFVAMDSARPEVWAYGLRNPWRFSFDRANGDLWIADVGGSEWEEVDYVPAASGTGRGANFGWSLREGAHDTDKTGDRSTPMVEPIFEYSHDEGSSITGGFVYRGTKVPELTGVYLFSDFSAATLRGIRVADGKLAQQAVIRTTGDEMAQVSSFGQDNDGELYVLSLGGAILRIG
jgi:glucose/arabinose dehydrogenase